MEISCFGLFQLWPSSWLADHCMLPTRLRPRNFSVRALCGNLSGRMANILLLSATDRRIPHIMNGYTTTRVSMRRESYGHGGWTWDRIASSRGTSKEDAHGHWK